MKQLKNFMEEVVEEYLSARLANTGVCQCEDCRLDIMAIMLNRLPSHYIVTDKGALFAQLKQFDPQNTVDIAVALEEAVAVVKSRPQHK